MRLATIALTVTLAAGLLACGAPAPAPASRGATESPAEALAPTSSEPGLTDDTILIGMEGPANSFSVDEENLGMRIVVQQVNDDGGIHGRRLVLRGYPRSGGAAADQAVANARRLVDSDQVFLLFNFGGPQSVRVAELAMDRRVPQLFPHTALITEEAQRYVFTSYPRYQGESEVMWRHLTENRGATRFAIVYADNVYGTFFRDRLTEYAARDGHDVTGTLPIGDREPGDLRDALATIRAGDPDVVILAIYPAQARAVMAAKAALDWTDVTMVSSGPLTDEPYLQVEGGYAEGTLGFCHYPDPAVADEPGVADYRALMHRYYPERPLNRYSLYGYVFGKLMVDGLGRAGRDLTREAFIDAMESIADWDSGGILPPVSFSPLDHHAQDAGFICELREGRFEAVTEWVEP